MIDWTCFMSWLGDCEGGLLPRISGGSFQNVLCSKHMLDLEEVMQKLS